MNSLTDYIVLGLLFLYFLNGWSKGFWKTILGPISLIIGWIGAYIYYLQTKDLIMGLILSIVGPFVVKIALSLIIGIFRKDKTDRDDPILTLGRLLGAGVSVAWSGSILALSLILLSMLPLSFEWYEKVKLDIIGSQSYATINSFTGNKLQNSDTSQIVNVFKDPEKLKEIQESEEYKDIIDDQKVQAVLTDESIIEQIQNKNYIQLMQNPKVLEIANDPELVKKFLTLNQKMMEPSVESSEVMSTTEE